MQKKCGEKILKIQGITISLGMDSSGIEQALKDVNKASSATSKELGQINRALKFDPDNVNLLSQKFDVLQDSIRNTETKLSALREAQAEVNRQFEAGEIDASAYRAFQREIEQTEGRLRAFRQQAEDVQTRINVQADTTGIEKMKAAMKELGPAAKQAASEIGNALSTAGAAGTAAIAGLTVGMADTNKDLAMLETQISQVGLALEDIGNARTTFDSVGQETDQVTEAMGNLIQAGYDTKASIDDISSSLAGAIVKYGDTFNVEGLAESITTTTQLGEVTGQLTDLLEKEGINVENFNAKIQSMSTEQERANYISQLLADQGLTSLYNKYAEGNTEIVNASSAQISMTDALSQLSIALTPLVTMVAEFTTKIVEWANENQGLATVLAVVAGAITALSGVFAVLSPIVTAITTLWPALVTAFGAISAPIAIAIAAITALTTAGIALWKNWDEVSVTLKSVWEGIQSTASTVFSGIGDVFKTAWENIKSTTETVWNSIQSFFSSVWDGIKSVFDTVVGVIESSLNKYWNSMGDGVKKTWDGIKQYFDGVWDLIKNVFVGALLVITQLLTGKWGEAKKSTEQIWKNIQDALKNVWEGIKKVFSGALDAVKGFVKTAWDNIKSTTTSIFNTVKSTISNVWESVKSTTSSILKSVGDTVKSTFTSLVGSVSEKMSEVKSTIEKWWGQALSFLKGIDLTQIGRDIIRGLINGITNMTGDAIEAITGVVDGIVNKAKSALKIKSPSRVMMEIGRFIGDGLIVGMEQRGEAVTDEARKIASNIINSFEGLQAVDVASLEKLGANKQIKELAQTYNEILEMDKDTSGERERILKASNEKRVAIEAKYAKVFESMEKLREEEFSKLDATERENPYLQGMVNDRIQSAFGVWVSEYTNELNDVAVAEKKSIAALDKVLEGKFDKQKEFASKAKELNLLSIKDELKMYDEFSAMYAEDSEEFKYFSNEKMRVQKEMTEAIGKINDNFTSKIKKANDDLIANTEKVENEYKDAYNNIRNNILSATSGFGEFQRQEKIQGQTLVKNLESQIRAINEYNSVINSLGGRVSDTGFMDYLRTLGPESLSELEAINSLSKDELDNYVALYNERFEKASNAATIQLQGMRADTDAEIVKLQEETAKQLDVYQQEWATAISEITNGVVSEFEELPAAMEDTGKSIITGIQSGLSEMTPALISQAEAIANAISSTIKEALDINSPSGITRGFGVNIGQGLIIGMDDMIGKIAQTSQRLSSAASNALGSLASSSAKSQANQVVQQQITNNSIMDMTGLIQVIAELAQRPVQTSVTMDGRVIANAVSSHQYNNASLSALTKGVSLG